MVEESVREELPTHPHPIYAVPAHIMFDFFPLLTALSYVMVIAFKSNAHSNTDLNSLSNKFNVFFLVLSHH